MLSRLAALALLALPAVSGQVTIPLTNCGTSADHITITSATANVWPPVPGQALDLNLAGSTDEDITGGTYEAKVSVDFLPILDKTGNISDLVKLPILKGSTTITKSVTLPAGIPAGTYVDIQVTADDQNGSELVCVTLNATLAAPFKPIVPVKPQPIIVQNFNPRDGVPVTFTTCGSGDITVSALTASVWPPVPGQALTVDATGDSSIDITGGSYEVAVALDGFTLLTHSGDLSTIVTLPITAGTHTLSKTATLPSILPAGSYTIQANGTDQNGGSLGCVSLAFTIA